MSDEERELVTEKGRVPPGRMTPGGEGRGAGRYFLGLSSPALI
jgi:hypothetical protein